jgi:type IV pilus assembly protein PilE
MEEKMNAKGFTLIELMVVVAIVAILAAIAYPSYTNFVRRGKIVDATATLSNYRVSLEQFFQDNRHYGTGGACGIAVPTSDYFTYTCTTAGTPSTSFSATASSKAGGVSATASSHVYTLDQSNTRTTTAFPGTSGTANCWLIRGSEC